MSASRIGGRCLEARSGDFLNRNREGKDETDRGNRLSLTLPSGQINMKKGPPVRVKRKKWDCNQP